MNDIDRSDRSAFALGGTPVPLVRLNAATRTNRRFADHDLARLDAVFVPPALAALTDGPLAAPEPFLEDDNRGAVSPRPVATIDGRPFFLSVKGIGSAVDPYAHRPLDGPAVAALAHEARVADRLRDLRAAADPRWITGELWLRGSPYGGQGIEHATTALALSERADLTSLRGFRIAPVVKVARLPASIEEVVRSIYWYRQYPGAIVQELRLVPSNVRVYFHARETLGAGVRGVFDRFGLASSADAVRFEVNLVRSGIAMLTLFARTMTPDPTGERFSGLDYFDVWLDKDAVLATDGTLFFVDLEGIETVVVPRRGVREKIEDQIYRSLYELTFAYEQVEQERVRRFGDPFERRAHFERVAREALEADPYVRLRTDGPTTRLEVGGAGTEENLLVRFDLLSPA